MVPDLVNDTLTLDDVVYQEEELLASFVIEPGAGLDDLDGDDDDIQMPVKWKWKPIKKKVWLSSLRTRVPYHYVDEFWDPDDKLSTAIIFVHIFFHFVYFS
jgi:hypothetical protein